MSVERMSPSPTASAAPEPDLETTAELPVLDVAAYEAAAEARTSATDAWVILPPAASESEPEAAVPEAVEPGAAAAPGEERLNSLQISLQGLSGNLREVEERLRLKGERLAEMEKALTRANADRDAATVALRDQGRVFERQLAQRDRALSSIQKDLTAAQASATTYMEALRSTEGRRGFFQELYTSLHWEVESRIGRVTDLEAQITALGTRAHELESRVSDRDARIGSLEKQLAELHAALSQRDAQQSVHLSERQAELERLLAEKAVLSSNVSTLEAKHTAAIARIAELEAASSTAQSRSQELDAAHVQSRKQIEQLEAELVTVRSELQQRVVALGDAATARSEHMARIAAGDAHVEELQGRIQEQHEFVRVLQADSNASVARVKELEGDLRAAEDMIHRLETDLRHRSARLDELEKTNHEWRSTVEEARNALTDRDSLIRRLEEETANSAVLLGAIQQRLDSSGVHEIAPDGDKRLLIRTDGDSEVVHVLGRKTSVGRTPDNDLQIDAKFISRHHAVILAGPAHTIIEDLNSTNGVLVNGRRITRQALKDGDAVVIGKTLFRFAVRPSAAERRA
jgi:DNA repair exonuclease SbcCD ATPase subunit